MYYKIINDRMVFSLCKSIQANDGSWISNPTEEQILAAGWQVYVPPVIPPEPQLEPEYGDILDAVKRYLSTETETMTDEEALEVAALFPTWESVIGEEVHVGDRLWYDAKLWKVIQAHVAQDDWAPASAHSLFTEVSIEEWPEFVQPTGAADAYKQGDKVTFQGRHYVCLVNDCVWSPADYPAGWELHE